MKIFCISSNHTLKRRSGRALLLLAILVLLVHLVLIKTLRQSINLPTEYTAPLPFKLEVSLLGQESPNTNKASPPVKIQPKSEPKKEPKKTPVVKDQLSSLGEIEQQIKSQAVKEISKTVKHQPGQQTAQTVASAMVMPPKGGALSKDNFPISDEHNPSPEYPEMAIFLGYQGTAIVRIKVSAKGLNKGVEILRSSGHKMLDQSAAKALRNWRFTPSKRGSSLADESVVITVIFTLYGKNG
jgi:periplasmic protein TonB